MSFLSFVLRFEKERHPDNAELRNEKRGESWDFSGIAPGARHYPALQKISQLSQRTMVRIANDDMIEHFDFKELPYPDKVTGHFDVSF